MLKTRYSLILIIFAGIFLLGACQANTPTPAVENTLPPAPTEELQENSLTPAVSVSDQEIDGSSVTIAEVISSGPGWLVIHAQADGKPGPILGFSPVEDGTNPDVTVEIELAQATETIYAMLHTDAGEAGTFEFPDGPDGPVSVDGSIVTPAFQISGLAQESTFTLSTAEDPELGPYLADGEGMSLYLFTNDEPGTSNCYDNCAVNWPPLLLEGDLSLGEGLDENLVGTTERNGGSLQVTYNEWPLYYFIQDSSPGDIKGQGVGEVWYLISPEGSEIVPVDY